MDMNFNQNQMNPMMMNQMNMNNPMMMNNMNMNNPMMMNNMNMNNPMMMNNMNMNNPMMMNNMNMNPMMMNNMNMNPMMMNNMNMNPMMMNQMMMMFQNMNNGNNANNANNNNTLWNLVFEKKNGEQSVNLSISPNSTVQEAINLYRIRTNQVNDEIKFIFNGKQLDYSLSISQSGLNNGAKITVIGTRDVEGA